LEPLTLMHKYRRGPTVGWVMHVGCIKTLSRSTDAAEVHQRMKVCPRQEICITRGWAMAGGRPGH
jgi:hypothetical protein